MKADEKITLELTRDEARALMDGWAFALGPGEKSATVRKIIMTIWANKMNTDYASVRSVTVKLTEILDKFLQEYGVDISKLENPDLDWKGLGL